MATTLATEVQCRVRWLLEDAADLTAATDQAELDYERATAEGTGAQQANRIWRTQRTLSAGSSDEWDLSNLTAELLGGTTTTALDGVKAVVLRNLSQASGDVLRLKSGATQPWLAPFGGSAGAIEAGADGCLMLASPLDGWMVAAGSADRLRVENPGASAIEYQLVIVGAESA